MFKRILYEDWQRSVPIIAFILTFGVFIFFVVRAIRLHRDEAGRIGTGFRNDSERLRRRVTSRMKLQKRSERSTNP